jgi:molybdate transport system permease protein
MIDWRPLLLSIRVSVLAVVILAIVGFPFAYFLARSRSRIARVLEGVATLPLVLPPTVLGFGLLQLLGRRGYLGRWLGETLGIGVAFHWTGAVIAATVAAFPLFLIPARAAFAGVDPALEDVARLLGRSNFHVFRSVTFPLAWRGLAAGGALAFARAMGDFGTTLMLAGNLPGRTQTAALAIYDAVESGRIADAWKLSIAVATISLGALFFVERMRPTARETAR